MSDWRTVIRDEWIRRSNAKPEPAFFPLISQSFDEREIVATVEALLTGQLTMGQRVREFERQFADYVGAQHAVMVNSGSSAVLLAAAVATNPAMEGGLRDGDEVLVPAVCWSTSVWPLVQMRLKPVFVDVDDTTLNVDITSLKSKLTEKTRAIMAVHVLGGAGPMREVLEVVHDNRLLLFEDTCESLGATYGGRKLGTFGTFGCYSFYYSHHITTGEGGMVVCNRPEHYDLLKCLRAHGWSRELSNRAAVEQQYPELDPRFLFVNSGFNLRPLEIQAVFGACQLERLDAMNATRNANRASIIEACRANPRWRSQFSFAVATPDVEPAWFGLPILLEPRLAGCHRDYLTYLTSNGIENRPIISGNFVRQPAVKLLGIDAKPDDYPGAERVNNRGFFIGLHTEPLPDATVTELADIMLSFDFAR